MKQFTSSVCVPLLIRYIKSSKKKRKILILVLLFFEPLHENGLPNTYKLQSIGYFLSKNNIVGSNKKEFINYVCSYYFLLFQSKTIHLKESVFKSIIYWNMTRLDENQVFFWIDCCLVVARCLPFMKFSGKICKFKLENALEGFKRVKEPLSFLNATRFDLNDDFLAKGHYKVPRETTN